MGAMLAERLTEDGRSVALFDRRPPGHGATAASTALVMWAADTPLTHLADSIGPLEAARRWRRVHQAVLHLASRVATSEIACGWRSRTEVYLDGDLLDAAGLAREAELRRAWGLPSGFLSPEAVAERFGVPPRPAIVSGDAYEVDPVALTLGLLTRAQTRGATTSFPVEVTEVQPHAGGVRLILADGASVISGQTILATGYEVARAFLPPAFTLSSSYAIATAPGVAPLWTGEAMIWEAADPYLYARSTMDGRVIVGGCDEDFADPQRRDSLIEAKRKALSLAGGKLLGVEPLEADCAWAAAFGGSPDGLPAIGEVRGFPGLWLAAGFGGNGVTFASLAADLIASALGGRPDPDLGAFSPYRFDAPAAG